MYIYIYIFIHTNTCTYLCIYVKIMHYKYNRHVWRYKYLWVCMGFFFIIGIEACLLWIFFCFHGVFQDDNFYLHEQEFVIGSARLEKTFESIESNWWPNSSLPTKPSATSSLFWNASRDGDCTSFLGSPFQRLYLKG